MDPSNPLGVWTTDEVAIHLNIRPALVRSYTARAQIPAPDGYLGRTPWWWPETIRGYERLGQGNRGDLKNGPPPTACPEHRTAAWIRWFADGLTLILGEAPGVDLSLAPNPQDLRDASAHPRRAERLRSLMDSYQQTDQPNTWQFHAHYACAAAATYALTEGSACRRVALDHLVMTELLLDPRP